MSISNHHAQQLDEPIKDNEINTSHNPFLSSQQQQQQQPAQKHIIYFDDYEASPPSYDVAQESSRHHHQTIQTSDAEYRSDIHLQPSEDIPLNTYHQNTSSEPETAPLMMTECTQNEHVPSAPSFDQVELNTFESIDKNTSKKNRKITLARIFLACCVWFAGITFMSVSLYAYECYDNCESEEECNGCLGGIRKGGLSLIYTFFILACIFVTWKAVRFTLS